MWLVWVNGTPLNPQNPLNAAEAIDHFRDQVEMAMPEDGDKIEIRAYEP